MSTLCLYRAGYDFKRLFSISEYYDRDRIAFYQALQDVRRSNMDMTGWIEFFTRGLATQLVEVKDRGELAIRQDVLARRYQLSERQALASVMRWSMGSSASETFRSFVLRPIGGHFNETSGFWWTRVCFSGGAAPISWNTFQGKGLSDLTPNLRHNLRHARVAAGARMYPGAIGVQKRKDNLDLDVVGGWP